MIPPLPRLVVTLICCVFASVLLRAADVAPTPLPPGSPLVAAEDFEVRSNPALVDLRRRGLGERHGEPIWSVETAAEATDPWLVQLKARTRQAVRTGDVAIVVVQARAVRTSHESDQAQLRLVVADEAKPFPRIAVGHYFADREWREFALPFTFPRDFSEGDVTAMLDLGFGRQTVELSGLRVVHFGAGVPISSLPRTRPSYRGHEPDAAWRREALARIERLRKGELALEVVDAAGRPVAADLRAVLRSHAFEFGVAVNVDTFTADSPDTAHYRRVVGELFNAATLENALKWGNWLGEKKPADYRARTFETLAWLRERDFAVRGHVMVWPGKRFLPAHIVRMLDGPDRDRIPALVIEHIRDIATATKDHIAEWDVVNEPINNHDLMDAFGRGIMVEWFKEAAKAVPGVPLFLNDWGNHDQRQSPAHVKAFEETARYLIDQGAPLGGFGLQCHIGGVLSPPEDILATLDRYQANFNLPVRATEFDVAIDDEEIQAAYTRDFMIAMFSHPSVVGVQHWGFWAGRHWQPNAALFTKDWKERPNGAAYRKLIRETWHTDASGRSDEAGCWSTPAFFGTYEVTVRHDGHERIVRVEHRPGAGGGPLRVRLAD